MINLEKQLSEIWFEFYRALPATSIDFLVIEEGININAIDKYESVALIYSLTVLKLTTQDAYLIYELLLKHNADYTLKNDEGKSALD